MKHRSWELHTSAARTTYTQLYTIHICMVYNFSHVCLYVYPSDDNFWKPWCRKFIFAHPVISREYGSASYM